LRLRRDAAQVLRHAAALQHDHPLRGGDCFGRCAMMIRVRLSERIASFTAFSFWTSSGARRLVEEENARLLVKRAGRGGSLLLAPESAAPMSPISVLYPMGMAAMSS
jgi:hypothetical protein